MGIESQADAEVRNKFLYLRVGVNICIASGDNLLSSIACMSCVKLPSWSVI